GGCNHNNDSDCPPCGGSGQACCGGVCNGAMLLCQSGKCAACGGSGQPCCGSDCGGGLECRAGKCQVPCGQSGQPCCAGGSCQGDLGCNGSTRCQTKLTDGANCQGVPRGLCQSGNC